MLLFSLTVFTWFHLPLQNLIKNKKFWSKKSGKSLICEVPSFFERLEKTIFFYE
jgi:hypothetical protein